MMNVTFDYEARYREFSGKTKPCVVVMISFQGKSYPHPMLVDSGADCTIISSDIGRMVFDIEFGGAPTQINTAAGSMIAWGPYPLSFKIEAETNDGEPFELPFTGDAYFAETTSQRLTLGRVPFFNEFIVCFHELYNRMYFTRVNK